MAQAEIGIIGGSGLYSMPGFTNVSEERVETPFGEPSDPFVLGELEGHKVAFLARHGRGHRILPSELNFRANIYAFKKLGVERIISISAVGSLKEEHKPTDFVMPDQFIDRTFDRTATFFGEGIVGHVAFGDPICATVSNAAVEACKTVGVVGKQGGTYVCIASSAGTCVLARRLPIVSDPGSRGATTGLVRHTRPGDGTKGAPYLGRPDCE